MDGTCIGHAHDCLRADPEAGGRYLGLDELTQMDRLLNLHRHGAILKLLKGAIPTQKSPRCVGPGGSHGDSEAPPRHFDPFRGPSYWPVTLAAKWEYWAVVWRHERDVSPMTAAPSRRVLAGKSSPNQSAGAYPVIVRISIT